MPRHDSAADLPFELRAKKMLAEGKTITEIARALGCCWHRARRLAGEISRTRASTRSEAPPKPPPPTPEERYANARALKVEKAELTAVSGEKSFRVFLENLIRDTVEPWPAPKPLVTKAPKGASRETLLFHWSDWHAYEKIDPEAVLGLNDYGAERFGKRVHRVVSTSLSIKDRLERGGGWTFPEAVIALNGDFISGTIHEVEHHSDAPNVVMAAYGTGMTLAAAIRDVAARFQKVRIVCTSGNHGRLPDARKVQQKDPLRSWDTAIYLFAKTALADCKNIEWHIPAAWNITYHIGPWQFYQGHGHNIKSWMHIPFYGIRRMASNLNAVYSVVGGPIHNWLFGHFHTLASLELAGGESFVNGSLIGPSEFAVNSLGEAGKPCQWMLLVHPEHGITGRWPILGNGGTDSYPSKPWVGA